MIFSSKIYIKISSDLLFLKLLFFFLSQLKFLVPGFASSVPTCQWLYIITFGGGLVEGDNVAVDVKVGENCTVVVTTQASTKVTETTQYNILRGNTHSSK